MHPEKEAKYLLGFLVDYWEDYVDGWAFSVTWSRDEDAWTLRAMKGPVDVSGRVTLDEWNDRHKEAVINAGERMYLASFAAAR